MFSKACEYGLRATLFLAQKSSAGKKLSIGDIATGIDAPQPFTAKVLQQLHRGGVIRSTKGPAGGFFLDAESMAQPIWNILLAFEEDRRFTTCILGLHKCNDSKPCPLHGQYKIIKEQLIDLFNRNQISDLAETMKKTRSFVKHQ